MKDDINSIVNKKIEPERLNFKSLIASNLNYFGNFPDSKFEAIQKFTLKTSYEEICSLGYNPDTRDMECVFHINRSYGYGGNLCTNGSFEYVRFYLDFHDGNGFMDQGSVRVNVHNIPAEKDCNKKDIFPLSYVATLKKKTNKFNTCKHPKLPTMRAILSWNLNPPPNSPNWPPVWGNVKECDIQLKPFPIIKWPDIQVDLSKYFEVAMVNPKLSFEEVSKISEIPLETFFEKEQEVELLTIDDLHEMKVPASRFAFDMVNKMVKYPTSSITANHKTLLTKADINVAELIDEITVLKPVDQTKANVDYEELICLGLDYNTETLVATLQIKKNVGYSGNLCSPGSKEYISFWIDWDDKCDWKYLDTLELNVHDIPMDGDHLCYSVGLPLDTTLYKRICSNPNVVRVRSVLSWNKPPSKFDPNKLEYYGNRIDSHIQIKPGIEINEGDVLAFFNIIGGVDVSHVNDITGLTDSTAFFAFNGHAVPNEAPFAGTIVLNGPPFIGHKYRIKLTNLNTGVVSYVNNSFTVVGSLNHSPWVQYTTQSVDGAGYYSFLSHDKNTLNVLARFNPGTNDKFRVEIEVQGLTGTFYKEIQMDNTKPVINLTVDDGGDCTHYSQGDVITGKFYVNDKHLSRWSFGSTWGGGMNGTLNTPALPGSLFSIPTAANAHPCGRITLSAWDKAIRNSQSVGHEVHTGYNVCL